MAAMAPERSRTLHNFSLPPRLTWGAQKLLRCSNSNPNINHNDDVSDSNRKRRHASFRSPPPSIRRVLPSFSAADDQIEVIREKLMLDLRSEVDKMRAAFLGNETFRNDTVPLHPPPPTETELRPWNLRARRAAMGDPRTTPSSEIMTTKPSSAPAVGVGGDAEDSRAKFSVALTRQEIEDDFMEMMGRRPPRKPKKRPRYVQKQLDTLLPGLWLSEITADMYKVNENPEPAK